MSKQATKIRLINCGYHTIQESLIFIDDKRVPAISFKRNSLGYNETFSISLEDLAFERLMHKELSDAFKNGQVVYIDDHVCINDPKYVEKDWSWRNTLTEYAKANADECLLKFKIVISDSKYKDSAKSQYCVLFREFCGIETKSTFNKDINKSVLQKAEAILKRGERNQQTDKQYLFALLWTCFSATNERGKNHNFRSCERGWSFRANDK